MFDYHIGVSDAMAQLLISRGFDPQTMFAIYNGIDFTPVTPKLGREDYLRSVGLEVQDDTVVFGIAARLDPVKDMPTLLRAVARARKASPNLRLAIAGEGKDRAKLEALAQELGIAEHVFFLGWLTDLDSFYGALDINTLTSLSETFPYALTEGARAHLPTVASDVGGVPVLIQNGVTGLLFEPGDVRMLAACLARYALDADYRQKMGDALYTYGRENFSEEATGLRQLEIYNTIYRLEQQKKGVRYGVLICGAYGFGNAGDEAILEAIISEMRRIDPNMPVTVLSRRPKETRRLYGVNAEHSFNLPRMRRIMRRCPLYLNGGGNLMQDVTRRVSLWYYL